MPTAQFTLDDLAVLALAVLDAQQRFFRSHSHADLLASKVLERKLRREARRIIDGPELFDATTEDE